MLTIIGTIGVHVGPRASADRAGRGDVLSVGGANSGHIGVQGAAG